LYLVSEGPTFREMDDLNLQAAGGQALDEWLSQQYGVHEVSFGGMDWSETEQRYVFGSETSAWINLQLARLTRE